MVLPPDIAKCLPKNRLLNEVRFIELRFVVFSRSFFPTVVLSAEEEEEDVLFSSLLFPCVLKICVESDDERRRIEILTKTSFSHSKTQNKTDGMARIRRATISRMGALRDSSTGTAHYALPKTAELRTSAVGRRGQVKKTKI